MFKKEFLLIASLSTFSCSHLPNGQFIQLRQDDSLKKLSREFEISVHEIMTANRGRPFQINEYYFIPFPLPKGVSLFEKNQSGRSVAMARSLLQHHNLKWPLPSKRKISSHFGRRWGKDHQGIDIAALEGTPILAADDGVVVFSGRMGGYGKVIVLAHYHGLFTVYAHNKKNLVEKGSRVGRGERIGKVGQTGKATGPHLHFEIRKNGQAINPTYASFKH